MDNRNMPNGVSIIIPAKNEEKFITSCLNSIQSQVVDIPLEVIVMDNLSVDSTSNLAIANGAIVYQTDALSPAGVRNHGAAIAKFNVLAFLDGDCQVSGDWLQKGLNILQSNVDVGACSGGCVSPENSNYIVRSWRPSRSHYKHRVLSKKKLLPGSNIIIRKEVFEKIGGFDENLITAEDDELCLRIMTHGHEILYDSEMSVIHHGYPKNLLTLLRKSIWHGSTQVRAHGLFKDKFVLTTSFLVFLLVFNLCYILLFGRGITVYVSVIVFLISPFSLMYKRTRGTTLQYKLKNLHSLYLVCITVIIGRMIGMMRELSKHLTAMVKNFLGAV